MSEATRAAGRRPSQGRVGSTINGKWHIDARIGSGGMATVYAATHRNGHRAALKMLHTQLSRDEATRARFLREGYVGNAVGHPGVVHVQDDGVTEDNCAFLVLDLLEGDTVEARRTRLGGMLPIDEVLEIADQALDALAAAHEKGIIHRDVKPDNVFMCTDGQVKLLDFGLARMKSTQLEATKTGVTIGTPEFMAPEQAGGRRDDVDARSDVWSLGATLFTLLTGKYVHDASTLHEQLVASATQRARGIRELVPHIPASIAVVIDRALELERGDRWASAREMQRAFRAARQPSNDSDKFVLESLTLPAASPGSLRRAPPAVINGGDVDPESGPRPSSPLLSREIPSSGRTLEMIITAPTSDPTIEDATPYNVVNVDVDAESLPSLGPMTPKPTTERLTGTGVRGPGAVLQVSASPQPVRVPPSQPTLASPQGLMRASAPIGPTLASGQHAMSGSGQHPMLGSGQHPMLGSGQHPMVNGASGQHPTLGSSGQHPMIGSGSGQHPTIGSGQHPTINSSSGAYPSLDAAAVIPARGSGSMMPNAAGRPSAPPHPHLPSAPPPPVPMLPGPVSLRQRRSASTVVIVSLLLIALCGAMGVWVLLHR